MTDIRLSPHFTLAELTVSEVAARRGLDNSPPPTIMPALERTAKGLEAVRTVLGNVPIIVTSGYRSPDVNSLVGGSRNSSHLMGEAADIIVPSFGSPAKVAQTLRDAAVNYDQLLLEFFNPHTGSGWVHISFRERPRRQALIIDKTGTRLMPKEGPVNG